MKLLANQEFHPIKIQTYIGEITKVEVLKIYNYMDDLSIDAFANQPDKSFKYVQKRIKWLSKIKSKNTSIYYIFFINEFYGCMAMKIILKMQRKFSLKS
jgi:SAM-dependent MidA family methyltransferase